MSTGRYDIIDTRWMVPLLWGLPWLAFGLALTGDFLWDDDRNVTHNPTLVGVTGLARIWFDPWANQQYYPLTHTSFWLERQLFGLWAPGFHLTNLLLHGAASVLVWRLARALQAPGGALAALLFAVHPLQAETVCWITERKNLLSLVLALLATLRLCRAFGATQEPIRPRDLWLGAVLFLAAASAKTIVVGVPIVVFAVVWWKRGRASRVCYGSLGSLFGVGVAFGLTTAWLERTSVGAVGERWEFSFLERLAVAGKCWWFYPLKYVAPVDLMFIYPRWDPASHLIGGWLALFGAALLTLASWWLGSRYGRGATVLIVSYWLLIGPALGFFDLYFFYYAFVQHHFAYHASVPLLLAIAAGLTFGLDRLRLERRWGLLLVPVLIPLSWREAIQFRDALSLWTETTRRNPGAWMAHINLGNEHQRRNELDLAERAYRAALEARPGYDEALYNLGVIAAARGDLDRARHWYQEALRVSPGFARAYNNLGSLESRAGNYRLAVDLLNRAVELEPRYGLARENLSIALWLDGQREQALAQLQAGLRLTPDDQLLMARLLRVLIELGRGPEARQQLQQYLDRGGVLPDEIIAAVGGAVDR
jgi:tetratricopeptide (TPR) repeat protein